MELVIIVQERSLYINLNTLRELVRVNKRLRDLLTSQIDFLRWRSHVSALSRVLREVRIEMPCIKNGKHSIRQCLQPFYLNKSNNDVQGGFLILEWCLQLMREGVMARCSQGPDRGVVIHFDPGRDELDTNKVGFWFSTLPFEKLAPSQASRTSNGMSGHLVYYCDL